MNASEQYQTNRKEIDAKIAQLKNQLAVLDIRQANDPDNWGYAGDAHHINNELCNVINTLTNRHE